MFEYKLGIIGTGNMAEAILKGVINSGALKVEDINAIEKIQKRADYIHSVYNIKFQSCLDELAINSKYILISVKPADVPGLLKKIAPFLSHADNVIISIAAGVPLRLYEIHLGQSFPAIRIMPNTPALLGQGISAISYGSFVKSSDLDFVKKLVSGFGHYVLIDEKLQNAVTAISGSGPAYFFLFCKMLAEAAVKMGIDRKTALKLVTHTAAGAAEMMKAFNSDTDMLIKMVASPGGTTEAALSEFTSSGFGSIVEKASEMARRRAFEIQSELMSKNDVQ
ncbi:MAG: pyrroline-5-carboxylate reductase [Actinobacteria bacterium]|nr:pyrroline-5-carboxylate reductase [Actinomycetota bacterium]